MEDIILIKVNPETQKPVLDTGKYYSCSKPKKFSQIKGAFIINKVDSLGIRLIASCTIKRIYKITDTNPIEDEFRDVKHEGWCYCWELEDINIPTRKYDFLKEDSSAKDVTKAAETMAYISSDDVKDDIRKDIPFLQKKVVKFTEPYDIEELVEVYLTQEDAKKGKKTTCEVVEIRNTERWDECEKKCVEDQILTLQALSNKKEKKFSAVELRKQSRIQQSNLAGSL